MAKFQKSLYLVLIVLIYTVETGLRQPWRVSAQTTTDTNTNVGNGLKPFRSTTTLTKSRIAFLVGINSYKATTSLKYAVGDSEAIEDLLLRTGKYDKLIKLNDSGKITTTLNPDTLSYTSQRQQMSPTKANIEATYQEVLAENPDTLLFYYSGHGFIEGEGGENYIAPTDVDVKFEKQKVGKEIKEVPVPLNGISLKVMGVQAAKVKRVVFLIDACRSPLPEAEGEEIQIADAGKKELTAKDAKSTKETKNAAAKESIIEKAKEFVRNIISVKTETLPKRVLEAEGITMLIGAAPEVSSLEDEDFKSGIFTHFLKKAFNGGVQEENQEEYITEENLSRYIEDRFKHYYELRKKESETAAEPKLYNLTFDRGKKGELLLTYHRPIEGKERIDKPIYFDTTRDREVNGKLVYNEKGEREDLRFFVHDEKRDVYYPDSLEGVYKMEYGFEKDKAGELENFTATEFNLKNDKVFEYGTKLIPDVGWEYRGLYAQTEEDKKSEERSKIKFERKVYDFNGNNISEEYFDKKGQSIEMSGVAKIVRAYDKDGQMILEEFYAKDTLDEYGDVVEKGKLVAKDGFARYKAKYKSRGNLLLETWEDVEGKTVNNPFGFAKTKYIYDKNNRLIKKSFYDQENNLTGDKSGVSTYQYSYNSNCLGLYESKINEIKKNVRSKTLTEWKLGKYKLCLAEEIHTNAEGKPANDENQVYKRQRSFNKKGFLVSEESFRADGRRHLENGVAKVVYAHDKKGNIVSRKNFGEFEIKKTPVPVSDGNGVHEYRYIYQEYFNYDGKPILNECMYHRKDKGILPEPYDCALKVEHFGIDGKPIWDKRNFYRTNIYYTGAYQEEAARHYYSLDNRYLLEEKKSSINNPFGNNTVSASYLTKEGKEVLIHKWEYKYDERNNKTLWAKYETIGLGLTEVLVWKCEYKYDEKNNNTLVAEYKTKEGKEVLIHKEEYKYDEKNNKTLEAKYETKNGKDVLFHKKEYKYDEKNNKTIEAIYKTKNGKDVLIHKKEYKYDERNNQTIWAFYDTEEGKEVLVSKSEYKYDERNNKTLATYYETKEGKVVLVSKEENKYDERNNKTLATYYETKEGKVVLIWKYEMKYDEKNNKTIEAFYDTKEGKVVLVWKDEFKYDEKNNMTFFARYILIEGKEVLIRKEEFKYDERNNKTLDAFYEKKEGKEVLIRKYEWKYDERNNKTLFAKYETKEGKEVLVWKEEYKYDEKNNKTLEAKYETKEGKEVLVEKKEYKYDERNNKTLEAKYETKEGELVLSYKNSFDFRTYVFAAAVTKYEPQIKEIESHLEKIKDNKEAESEKKSLSQKLEDLKKEFEAKKKKYTLTEEKFGPNEKLEYASYKLLFFNPRGPAEKRLMRVDLDQFYRPVKVGFEEE